MDNTTDLKTLARLLAEKKYPDLSPEALSFLSDDMAYEEGKNTGMMRVAHERAILPFLELLVEGNMYTAHDDECLASIYNVKCTCGLSAYLDKINAIRNAK